MHPNGPNNSKRVQERALLKQNTLGRQVGQFMAFSVKWSGHPAVTFVLSTICSLSAVCLSFSLSLYLPFSLHPFNLFLLSLFIPRSLPVFFFDIFLFCVITFNSCHLSRSVSISDWISFSFLCVKVKLYHTLLFFSLPSTSILFIFIPFAGSPFRLSLPIILSHFLFQTFPLTFLLLSLPISPCVCWLVWASKFPYLCFQRPSFAATPHWPKNVFWESKQKRKIRLFPSARIKRKRTKSDEMVLRIKVLQNKLLSRWIN